jgi:hypothetical protein
VQESQTAHVRDYWPTKKVRFLSHFNNFHWDYTNNREGTSLSNVYFSRPFKLFTEITDSRLRTMAIVQRTPKQSKGMMSNCLSECWLHVMEHSTWFPASWMIVWLRPLLSYLLAYRQQTEPQKLHMCRPYQWCTEGGGVFKPLPRNSEGPKMFEDRKYSYCLQWRNEGGFGVFKPPPPPKFWRPTKIVPNSTRLWKLLKIPGFRTPTPQYVREKGSKILKLPRFAIILH